MPKWKQKFLTEMGVENIDFTGSSHLDSEGNAEVPVTCMVKNHYNKTVK